MKRDLVIIGGGPAGLAAAIRAGEAGVSDILIIERDKALGGILNQCIHNGFGLHRFREELSGPEYAGRFIKMLEKTNISVLTDTMVLDVTAEKRVVCVSSEHGYMEIDAGAIVLAMGCRERTRGAIGIPGDRPSGVFTAGTAQRYLNLEGYMCGKKVVILGSGDIGLIMARRMTLEGAQVLACVEVMPYSGGLMRNIVQCLEDFDIPLYLSHTVTEVQSENGRVSGVTVQKVDERRAPIPGTEINFDCDTLLLSVGLIPENELSRQAGIEIDPRTSGPVVYENMETSVPGIFACGNVVHVHDLVDYVSMESERAGEAAAACLKADRSGSTHLTLSNGDGVTYTVPQRIKDPSAPVGVFFRVNRIFEKSVIRVTDGDNILFSFPRSHMAPGEMEKITLSPAVMEKAAGKTITIRCEEA